MPPRRSAAQRIPLAVLRAVGRIAFAILKPVLPSVFVLLVLVGGALVALDRTSLWDADGPLASTGLLDADGVLVRWRIAGDDRLVWKLPFVGPDGESTTMPAATLFRDRWPEVPAMEPVDLAQTTLIASIFPDDRGLFSFETSDARIWAEGTRTADGRADKVARLIIDRGRFRTTVEFDQQGRVERVEQLDRDGLGSAAIGVIYGDEFIDLVMFSALSSPSDIGTLRLSFVDYPELRDFAYSPRRQAPSTARSLAIALDRAAAVIDESLAPQDARRFLDIALTILDADGDELDIDILEGIRATFEITGVAVSPKTQLRSRTLSQAS